MNGNPDSAWPTIVSFGKEKIRKKISRSWKISSIYIENYIILHVGWASGGLGELIQWDANLNMSGIFFSWYIYSRFLCYLGLLGIYLKLEMLSSSTRFSGIDQTLQRASATELKTWPSSGWPLNAHSSFLQN